MDSIYFDSVTQGYNYTKFKKEVSELFSKNPNKNYVIFYSDIKNFKYINDVYGFEIGNKILKRYSDLLTKENKLCVARVSADNFVSIEEYEGEEKIINGCLKRIERISDMTGIIDNMAKIVVYAGAYCTNGNNHTLSIDAMIDRANIAQKQLREIQGESGCILYDEKFRQNMILEQQMENKMEDSLANGEFVVYLQPKFSICKGEIEAAEALVRWKDKNRGVIPPMEFIPLFERNGFIKKLDTYIFTEVCKLLRKWLDAGKSIVSVSVNVSKQQLNNPNFLKEYISIRDSYHIPDGLVEIEFTESMLFDNTEKMESVLQEFRLHGFRSSIDDFGAGYSSLNLLKSLPVDILKLDKLFFDESEYMDREKIIIRHVISMAKELSMQTVAEGIESLEQVEFLKLVQCEMAQGYYYDKPLPVSEFEAKYIT